MLMPAERKPSGKQRIKIEISDMMSIKKAAEYKGVTPRAIYQRIDRGLLPVVDAGNVRLVYRHHLDAWEVDRKKQEQDRSQVAKKSKKQPD